MRLHLLIPSLAIAAHAGAQCGPYVAHPLWPDQVGSALFNIGECGPPLVTVVWDNGATGPYVNGLSVGPHWAQLYDGATLWQTVNFEVQQLEWDLNPYIGLFNGSVSASIWAEVPYCGTSIFNSVHCPPVADSTVVRLLQDGIAIDSITPVSCTATAQVWENLPTGHIYQLQLVDNSHCGTTVYSDAVIAYDCADALVQLEVSPADQGQANGSITVASVMPAPTSSLPPPMPLLGTFVLYAEPGMVQVGDPQFGGSALWEQLPAGDYELSFIADVLCDCVQLFLTVDQSVGLSDAGAEGALRLWPVPAVDALHLSRPSRGPVRITDAQGRVVLESGPTASIDVSALAPGAYLLQAGDAAPLRFIKR